MAYTPHDTSPNAEQVKNKAELEDKLPPEKREALRWIKEIESTEKRFDEWRKRSESIVERYRDERHDGQHSNNGRPNDYRRYNVFWSLVQTEKPHLFMEMPRPFVKRRFSDRDSVARDASLILQRVLSYGSDGDDTYDALDKAVDDLQLTARGTTWVRYTPFFKLRTSVEQKYFTEESELPDEKALPEGYELGEDEGGRFYREKYQVKVGEECDVTHVLFKDFLHEMVSDWRHVGWVARLVPMLYSEAKERFGEDVAEKLQYTDRSPKPGTGMTNVAAREPDDFKGLFGRARVWEIWDRSKRQVIWICPDFHDSVLDKKDDIYGLEGFYPCPKPMYGTTTPESLIPVPLYYTVQDTLDEIDEVTQRLKLLVSALRVAGCYDSAMGEEITRIVRQTNENELIPVDSWAAFAERGGLKGAIDFLPLAEIIAVVKELSAHRRQLMQELYEVTGISDIVRGASDYRETARAQEVKGDFATMRLRKRQRMVARHARELLEIKAQLICKHYSDEEIKALSSAEQVFTKEAEQQAQALGQPPRPPQTVFDEERFNAALSLLRNDVTRGFRIKIDNETLGGQAQSAEQQQRVQFLQSVGQYITGAMEMAKTAPNFGPVIAELLMFGVRGFPIGRTMEAQLEEAIEKVLSEGPGTDPNAQRQGKSPEELQIEHKKLQLDERRLGIEENRVRVDDQRVQMETQEKFGRLRVDAQSRERDAKAREAKLVSDNEKAAAQVSAQREAAHLNAETAKRGQDIQLFKIDGEAGDKAQERATRQAEKMIDGEMHIAALEAKASEGHATRELDSAKHTEKVAAELAKAEAQQRAAAQNNTGDR